MLVFLLLKLLCDERDALWYWWVFFRPWMFKEYPAEPRFDEPILLLWLILRCFPPKAWGGINYWVRNPKVLFGFPHTFDKIFPKRYSDDVVSLSQRPLISSIRTGFKRSFCSFDICLCTLPSNVIESILYPITCLRSSDLDSVLVVSISSVFFSTAVVTNVRDFWGSFMER